MLWSDGRAGNGRGRKTIKLWQRKASPGEWKRQLPGWGIIRLRLIADPQRGEAMIIGIKSKREFMDEVKEDWLAIDRGESVPGPVTREYFETAEDLAAAVAKKKNPGNRK